MQVNNEIRNLFKNNYPSFLKNLLSSCFKIKNSFEVKSFKQIDHTNNQFSIEIGSTVKDIYNYSTKKIVEQYLMKFDLDMRIDSVIKLNETCVEETSASIYSMNYEKDQKLQVKFLKNIKNEEETFLEIWYDSVIINSVKLDEFGIGKFYVVDIFGKPKFSPDGKKIIFLAEFDNSKKFKNYFKLEDDGDNINKEKEGFELNLSKFEYKQDFGETLIDKSNPVIFVFEISTGKLNYLNLENYKNFYPAHAMFDYNNTDIIFSGFYFPFFKYGIIYCLKRKSSIFIARNPQLEEIKKSNSNSEKKEKNKNKIIEISNNKTHKENTNIFPIFSPDYNYLIWFSNENATPHMNGLRLNRVDWRKKKNLDNKKNAKDEEYVNELNSIILFNKMKYYNRFFNGIYSYEDFISKTTFINNEIIIFNSIHKNTNQAYLYDIPENRMLRIPSDCNSQQLIFSNNNYNILVTLKSDVDKIPHLDVIHFNFDEYKKEEGLEIEKLENGVTFLKDFSDKIFSSCNLTKTNSEYFKAIKKFSNFSAFLEDIMDNVTVDDLELDNVKGHVIYLNSKEVINKIRDENWKMPVVYLIHGGPNSSFDRTFLLSQLVFLAHGYMVLVVNYPGSTGYGQKYLSSLNGNIGKLDVEACINYLTSFIKLNKYKDLLDVNNLMLYGGSHGGYLSCWMVVNEKSRKLFSSAVVRNPVTDLCSSIATSDIPDWVLGQSTDENIEANYPPDKDLYNRMYDASPVFKASDCVTPLLFCIGKVDKRVNCTNGLYFYHCLLKAERETKLLFYPEDNHSLSSNETEIDCMFNIMNWFEKHLRK